MAKQENINEGSTDDIHACLEETLIEAYLKGKGYLLKELRAHFVEGLHEAHLGE